MVSLDVFKAILVNTVNDVEPYNDVHVECRHTYTYMYIHVQQAHYGEGSTREPRASNAQIKMFNNPKNILYSNFGLPCSGLFRQLGSFAVQFFNVDCTFASCGFRKRTVNNNDVSVLEAMCRRVT